MSLGGLLHRSEPQLLICTMRGLEKGPLRALRVHLALVLNKTRHFADLPPGGTREAPSPELQGKRPRPTREPMRGAAPEKIEEVGHDPSKSSLLRQILKCEKNVQ